jgi:hypothetical protein
MYSRLDAWVQEVFLGQWPVAAGLGIGCSASVRRPNGPTVRRAPEPTPPASSSAAGHLRLARAPQGIAPNHHRRRPHPPTPKASNSKAQATGLGTKTRPHYHKAQRAATTRQLERHYLWADAVMTADGVRTAVAVLGDVSDKGVLLVQGTHTPRGLRRQLEEAGAMVNRLVLNQLVPHPELGRPLPDHDLIYFVSPAGVRAYATTYGKQAFRREVWCLGRATQEALAEFGVSPAVVRPPLDVDYIVEHAPCGIRPASPKPIPNAADTAGV